MSAVPPKADMCSAVADVCFGPETDMRLLAAASLPLRSLDVGTVSALGRRRDFGSIAGQIVFRTYRQFRGKITSDHPIDGGSYQIVNLNKLTKLFHLKNEGARDALYSYCGRCRVP